MSEPKVHHYVPACYLRHFAVPPDRDDGRFWVYDREIGKSYPTSPGKAARERDFYRVDVDGESANLAEGAFGKLEQLFAPVIASVNERGTLPKDPKEMRVLVSFVAAQALRTPRAREVFARFHNDVGMLMLHTMASDRAAFDKSWRELEPGITDAKLDEAFVDLLARKSTRVVMDQTTLVGNQLSGMPDVEDVLALRFWFLGVAQREAAFVTTDDPVHLQWAGRTRSIPPMWSPGFGDPDTTVMVPLSPRLMLIGVWNDVSRARLRLSRRDVAGINTDLALAAHRFIYSVGPSFAHIDIAGGAAGAIVDGPTDALRRIDTPRPHGPLFTGEL